MLFNVEQGGGMLLLLNNTHETTPIVDLLIAVKQSFELILPQDKSLLHQPTQQQPHSHTRPFKPCHFNYKILFLSLPKKIQDRVVKKLFFFEIFRIKHMIKASQNTASAFALADFLWLK